MKEPTIIYAGKSERRIKFLEEIPGVKIESISGGPEPDISDVLNIAFGKIAYAFPRAMEIIGGVLNGRGDVILAADARTEVIFSGKNGEIEYVSKGKPKNNEEVFSTFNKMKQVFQPGYRLRAASVAQNARGVINEENICNVKVFPKGIAYLATPRGFDEYEAAYKEFYSTSPYSSHSLKPIGFEGISSGLSLPVLLTLGMVEGLGVDQEPTAVFNEDIVKKAIYTVAVGFGPAVLNKVHPQAVEAILQWSWLQQVAQKVQR